jgi:hypothetical protein
MWWIQNSVLNVRDYNTKTYLLFTLGKLYSMCTDLGNIETLCRALSWRDSNGITQTLGDALVFSRQKKPARTILANGEYEKYMSKYSKW